MTCPLYSIGCENPRISILYTHTRTLSYLLYLLLLYSCICRTMYGEAEPKRGKLLENGKELLPASNAVHWSFDTVLVAITFIISIWTFLSFILRSTSSHVNCIRRNFSRKSWNTYMWCRTQENERRIHSEIHNDGCLASDNIALHMTPIRTLDERNMW